MIVRNLEETDKPLLAEMIAQDEHHCETTTPEFFYQDGTKCLVYEEGDHRLFARLSNALRIDIQFNNQDRLFNAKTIARGFPKLMAWAKSKGFSEIVFFSDSPDLISFLRERFAFKSQQNELRLELG